MKRRLLRDGVDILPDHIQFDVISRVFLVALREEVTRIAFAHVERRQVGMTIHSINSNTRAPVRRFDHERILCLWNLLEKTRMSDEVRTWDGEPLSMGECRGDGLVTHQTDRSRVIDGWNTCRLGRLQDAQPEAARYRFQDEGVVPLAREIRQTSDGLGWFQEMDRMAPSQQLVGDDQWHRIASILLLNDEAQTHLPPCLTRFADHLQLRFPLQGSGYASHAGNSGVTRQLCGDAGRLRNRGNV